MAKVVNGVNDLYTWCMQNENRGLQIINEWTGIDSNNNLVDIHKTAKQSNKRVKWKCEQGHVWEATIQKRTLLMSDCPCCSGLKAIKGKNDIYTWCINNASELESEFTGEDADGNVHNIHEIAYSSHKKLKWKHEYNGEVHEWFARVADRTCKGSGCSICNGRNTLKPNKNDLYTWCLNNSEFGEILIEQWVGITNSDEYIKIEDIAYGSKNKIAWKCSCGNVWYASPLIRTYRKTEVCPTCSRESANEKRMESIMSNSITLGEWCSISGYEGEQIKEQFCGMDEYGNILDIDNITYGNNTKVLWQHTVNGKTHEWFATIHNRVCNRSGCPICNHRGTSLNEQIIYNCFKQLYSSTLNRAKYLGYEYDIAIPELKLCIEYGSDYYHRGKEARDAEKKELCAKYGVNFISIMQSRDTPIQFTTTSITGGKHKVEEVYDIIEYIFKQYNINIDNIDYKQAVLDAVRFMRGID